MIGVSDRVELIPDDSRRLIAAGAQLETCGRGAACNLSYVSMTVKLSTQHIGKGCDRDTYSLESQRKLCGEFADICQFSLQPGGDNITG